MSSKKIINKNMLMNNLFPQKDEYNPYSTKRTNYDIFTPDYFTAEDINLYIGDIWVDDLHSLEYKIIEDIFPIYGYGSYTYDGIARGKREVSGSMLINFKHANYIREVMKNSEAIEFYIQRGLKSKEIRPLDLKKHKLEDILKMLGKSSFDEMAEQYKKEIWGFDSNNHIHRNSDDETYFLDLQGGVEIKITYGPEVEAQNQRSISDHYRSGLAKYPQTTVEFLNGVQFYEVNKVTGVDISPSPVTEEYRFIARDISGVSLREEALMETLERDEAGRQVMQQIPKKDRPKTPSFNDLGPTTY